MQFRYTSTEAVRKMFAEWKAANPEGTHEELAQWLFDTFEDIQLSPMTLTRGFAKGVMQSPDWNTL